MWFRIIRALGLLPPRASTAAVLLGGLWLLTSGAAVLDQFSTAAAAGGFWLGVGVMGVWWVKHLAPAVSSGQWIQRRDVTGYRSGGVASWLDVGEYAGTWATRARARVLRPSLARLTRWQLFKVPLREFAVPVVRTSWLPVGNVVWSTCEEVTMRFGGPRSGKTGSLACHITDAPGAVLVTTSRTDLLDHTQHTRAAKGRVEVFNPTHLGHLASTVRWSAIAGCEAYATAQRRATDLLPAGGSEEGERWDAQARGLLAVLLHAAALRGGNLRTVQDWVSPPDDTARDQVLAALSGSPQAGVLQAEVRATFGMNDRTLTSITFTMAPALRWLNDAHAAACGDATPGHRDVLDVAAFVAAGVDSLYLIGRDGGARTLIGALAAEVAHQVRMHAATMPAGRLDPPLTMVLDEAPLTCGPIPLDDWTADMGGRGVTLHLACQSPAQVRDVWGPDRAEAILGNIGTLLVFGGLKTAADLNAIATLCGDRMIALDEDDTRPVPVMTPQQISALPIGTALVLRNQLRPVVGTTPLIWHHNPSRIRVWVTNLTEQFNTLTRYLPALPPTRHHQLRELENPPPEKSEHPDHPSPRLYEVPALGSSNPSEDL
jgi:type IV secretion system protein VirD4